MQANESQRIELFISSKTGVRVGPGGSKGCRGIDLNKNVERMHSTPGRCTGNTMNPKGKQKKPLIPSRGMVYLRAAWAGENSETPEDG